MNISLLKTISTCVAAMILAALPVGAQITQDVSASWTGTTTPKILNASGSDKLVVVVSGEHGFIGNYTGNCSAVTYNGQPLTLAVKQVPADPATGGHGQTYSTIWYLDNPGNYPGTGSIAVTCNSGSCVSTAIGLSGTLPGVGSTGKVTKTSSVSLGTASYGSMVIGAVGMGGQGNTATWLPGITATSPSQAVTVGSLYIGSNWTGHSVARALVDFPSTVNLGFNTARTDIVTVGAVFNAASPAVPSSPVVTVLDVVPNESVQLTWNNLLATQGSDVWVDLWIGDSPTNLTKVVSANPDGLNLTSFVHEAAPGTYYGRIDSYLNGSPTGTPSTGQAFSFSVDDKGLLYESWLSLRPLDSVLHLQKEGIEVRSPDTSTRLLASSLTNLPSPAGVRLRGLLIPTVTGNYNLHVAGSENFALWLSSNSSRFSKQRVAWGLEGTLVNEWGKSTSQKSATIHLQAGQSYYIEAQAMKSDGIGHLSIGWTPPGATTPVPVPVERLRCVVSEPDDLNDNNLPDSWEASTGLAQSNLPGALLETGDPDNDGIINSAEYALGSDPLVKESIANGITRDTWGTPGGLITDLTHTSRTRFLSAPSEIIHAPGIDDPALGSNVGTRYRGFLVAPVTGDYRLWIAGNNMCELWFADGTVKHPDTNVALTNRFGKQRLAHNLSPADWGASTYRGFDRLVSQRSRVVHLTAGEPYYIEVLHKKGGGTPSHISLAWQRSGQPRTIVPASAFLSDTPDEGDVDADFLPDAWETAKTLSPTDNGFTSALQGQYGDFDADGLTNLSEFQHGTNPKSADTDGDGLTDFKEVFYYGSNPKVSNTLAPYLAAAPNLQQYSAYTGGWNHNTNGSISAWDSRGEITYTFTLAQPGVHEIILKGAAIGTVRATEELPLVFSLDNIGTIARTTLISSNGGQGTVSALTPWLAAGTHTLTILHDNYRSARRLRIDSIQFIHLGGQDLDENTIPDWVEQNAAVQNVLTRIPSTSRTSPASIEGITQNLSTAAATYTLHGQTTPVPLPLTQSINNSFFADVPLTSVGVTSIHATYLNNLLEENHGIEWIATNLFEFNGSELHIRKGDSLRLDAWSGAAADAQAFTVTKNGTLLGDANQNTTHTSGVPLEAIFDSAGTFTLVATHGGQTSTVTLHVHSANFGPTLSVRAYSARTWTPPSLSSIALVEPDENLTLQETTTTGARNFSANLQQAGTRHTIARLPGNIEGAPSAILARGTVHGFYIAYLNDTADARIIHQYPDGTWLMAGTLIAVNLPPDILIKLRTHLQGTTFADGTNTRWLSAADFNANGTCEIYFEWSGTGDPKLCNHLQVFVEQ
ncbi:MAG: PA14 domain-containing protein [Verrucomicrobiota bacterium]